MSRSWACIGPQHELDPGRRAALNSAALGAAEGKAIIHACPARRWKPLRRRARTAPRRARTAASIRVLRDAAELASVRDAWLRLRRDQVAVDPDFFEAALRADRRSSGRTSSSLEENGTAQAMLIARIERLELAVRAGYRKLYAPQVRSLTVVYGGILGDVDEQMFRLLLGSVRRSLAEGEADVAIFRYLPLDSLVPPDRFDRPAGRQPAAWRGFRDPLGADPPGLDRRRSRTALQEVAQEPELAIAQAREGVREHAFDPALHGAVRARRVLPRRRDDRGPDLPARARRRVRRHAGTPRADAREHGAGLVPRLRPAPRRQAGGVPPRRAVPGPLPAREPGLRRPVRQPEHRHLSAPAPDRRPLQARRRARPRLRRRRRRLQAPVRDAEAGSRATSSSTRRRSGASGSTDAGPRSWRASAGRRGSWTGSASSARSSSVGARACAARPAEPLSDASRPAGIWSNGSAEGSTGSSASSSGSSRIGSDCRPRIDRARASSRARMSGSSASSTAPAVTAAPPPTTTSARKGGSSPAPRARSPTATAIAATPESTGPGSAGSSVRSRRPVMCETIARFTGTRTKRKRAARDEDIPST